MSNNILDINIQNKRVLIRVDYNVPIEDGIVVNNFRILQSLETIKHCLGQGASVVLMSHLGRPVNNDREDSLSLKPIAKELSKLLNLGGITSDFLKARFSLKLI